MKKIFTFVLIVLTLVLAGAAIFAGYYLTREDSTAPDDSSADQYLTSEFIIGGYPEAAHLQQWYACVLYENPCATGTGNDSVCYCPGYSDGQGMSVGCNVPPGAPARSANLSNRLGIRYGQSTGCAPLTCYRCTASTADGNTCESFSHTGTACPAGSSGTPAGCADALSSKQCPASMTCYRCTSDADDGNACESFTHDGSSCPAGSSPNANGCAQAAEGGACPAELTCYRCTVGLDDGNECESQTVAGDTCPTGWSTNSACQEEVEGDQCPAEVTPVDCGDSCTTNDDCSTGLVCDTVNSRCVLTECLNNSECTDNGCDSPTPECGDPCTSDTQCPVGHRCDTSRGSCVIELCLNNANCTNNGCTLPDLPGTALIGKTQDRLLIGILAILVGLVAIRFNAVNKMLEPLGRMESVYDLIPDSGVASKLRGKKKEEFEEKLTKK